MRAFPAISRLMPPMHRVLSALLLALMLSAPMATAHAVSTTLSIPSAVPASYAPSGSGGPAAAFATSSTELFGPEASVSLWLPPRSNDASWDSEPTTEYDLRFVCPSITETVGSPPNPTGQEPPTACPAYILDTEDIMAQPDLVIDPKTDDFVAFHALHGGPGIRLPTQDPLPTKHSRSNAVHQTHTEFWSRDGGREWNDNRYYSRLQGMAEVFGEDNAMAADPDGKLALASLYSYYEQPGQDAKFAVFLWSSPDRISTAVDYDKAYVVRFVGDGLEADSLDLVWHPGAKQMVTLWRTAGADGPRVHLEHRADQWVEWNATPQVGPCDALSNAIALGDDLVFACAAGSDTHLWAVHPDFTVEDLGLAPLHGLTSLRLANAESLRDGGLVLAGAMAREGRTHTVVVWGVDGKHWGRPSDFGESLTDIVNHPGAALVEAHLTALAVLGTSGTAHFLIQEEYLGGSATDDRIFSKMYGVVQSSGRFLGTFGIGYGDPQSRAGIPVTMSGGGAGAYHDAHDSLVVIKGSRGEERLIVAFGDYGYVRYGEVVEVAPPVPAFPLIGVTAAVPTLSVAMSPVLVGAVAGALSLAATSRIALAKSKKAAEVSA